MPNEKEANRSLAAGMFGPALGFFGGLAVAGAAALLLWPSSEDEPKRNRASGPTASTLPAYSESNGMSAAEIQRRVDRAVARRLADETGKPLPPQPNDDPEERFVLTEPPSEAMLAGSDIVRRAVSHQRWTMKDRLELKQQLLLMNRAERYHVEAELMRAINAQELKAETFPL